MQRSNRFRSSIVAVSVLGLLMLGGVSAHAATRSMTGSLGVINPSTPNPDLFESGPAMFGKGMGIYPPTQGFKTISAAGATAGTFVGRPLTIGANVLDFTFMKVRFFPPFSGVAQLTKSNISVQQAATFMEGGGALAACPGPGCTAAGAGTAISWCPPLAEPAAPGAPGTAGNQVGNWDCPSWPAGAGGGDRFMRIGITNLSGRNNFGGTFSLLRNTAENVWRVLVQPATPGGVAELSRSWMDFQNLPWTGGLENFAYQTVPGNPGPRIFGRLGALGQVTQTTGCVNGVGTVGQAFAVAGAFPGPGINCGTNTQPDPPGQGWGFKMTTGTIEGSDPYPFLNATTALGTPFAPNFQPSGGFFFTRMGTDTVTGTNRNLVLLGGGVSVDPNSGNAFFRITDLRLDLQVPEPAMGLGLLAGAAGLLTLAGRRIRR